MPTTQTDVKTSTISGTKLLVATLALAAAGGVALATVPLSNIRKLPDLVINRITTATPTIDGIPYTINYSNQGSVAAKGPFHIGLIAQDPDYNEIELGLNEITTQGYTQQIVKNYVSAKYNKSSFPTLPNGTGIIQGNIPWSLVNKGMTKFTAKIDMGEVVAESVETNNKFSIDLPRVTTPTPAGLPDLVIDEITFSSSTTSMVDFSLKYSNRGTAPAAGPFHIGFVAQDNNYTEIPIALNEISTPGYNQEVVFNYTSAKFDKPSFPTLPNGTGEIKGSIPMSLINKGMTKFSAKIDMGEVVNESIDNNNKFSVDLPVISIAKPDLVITNISLTSQVDGSVQYQLEYANQGAGSATGPFYIGIIAQTPDYTELPLQPGTITSNGYKQEMVNGYLGIKYAKLSFPTLPNGAGVVMGVIPKSLIDSGMTKFSAKIDMDENVVESNETNNKFSLDLPAGVLAEPDLVITNIALSPQQDGSVQYQLDYANQGTGSASGPFYIGIIAQTSDFTELPLQPGTISSNGYTQEMVSNYVGIKYTKASFPPLPNGTGVVLGTIPQSLIDQGMTKFSGKIDMGENITESVETNNKYFVDMPQIVGNATSTL